MHVSAAHQVSDKSGGKQWQTDSLCALPGKRQWFIVVTKGRSRPDGTFLFFLLIYKIITSIKHKHIGLFLLISAWTLLVLIWARTICADLARSGQFVLILTSIVYANLGQDTLFKSRQHTLC